jgi:hypothetical protein
MALKVWRRAAVIYTVRAREETAPANDRTEGSNMGTVKDKTTARPETNGKATPGQVDLEGAVVPAAPEPPVDEIRVDGTAQLGLFNAGGKRPTTSSLRLTGGRVMVLDGRAFKKGDTIHFEGTAKVDFVGQQDKTDGKTQIVVSAEQQHRARITDLRVQGED